MALVLIFRLIAFVVVVFLYRDANKEFGVGVLVLLGAFLLVCSQFAQRESLW